MELINKDLLNLITGGCGEDGDAADADTVELVEADDDTPAEAE